MFTKTKNFIKKFKRWIIGFLLGGTALAAGLSEIPQDLFNNLNVKVYTSCNLQEAKITSIADSLTTLKARNPDNSLREINTKERSGVKTCEMAKRGTEFAGIYDSPEYGVRIEIIGEVKAIEVKKHEVGDIFFLGDNQHGIELFARAWRGTQQLGFGSDGSVEIERFRIFNPPILVDDPNGTIIKESINPNTLLVVQRKLREDPIEAIRQIIAHNAKIVGKDNGKIIIGKIGNTTSTFYPDANPESTSVDGRTRRSTAGETWANLIAGDGTSFVDTGTTLYTYLRAAASGNNWDLLDKNHFLFDSSSIPDTDTISSATLSVYGANVQNDAFTLSVNIYSTNPASNVAIVETDHDTVGTTPFATAKAQSTLNNTNYNDFALNASGIAQVSKTGISKFGFAYVNVQENSEPTWSASAENYWGHYHADEAGTTADPKLVVVHSLPAVTGEEYQIIFEE